MKWRRGILVCALIVVGVVIFGFVSNYRSEPRYKGRSLSAWLRIYQRHESADDRREEAAEAVRHIGTNAIPYFLADLSYEQPSWRRKVSLEASRSPWAFRAWVSLMEARDRRGQAELGFGILGPVATPAVPKLVSMMQDSRLSDTAAIALWQIGRPALPGVVAALTNRANPARQRMAAAWALSLMGTNANETVSVLVGCLEDKQDASVAASACYALGNVVIDPETVIPVLTNALLASDLELRLTAIESLGNLGPRGKSAIPSLQNCLRDENPGIRNHASNALDRIDQKVPPELERFLPTR